MGTRQERNCSSEARNQLKEKVHDMLICRKLVPGNAKWQAQLARKHVCSVANAREVWIDLAVVMVHNFGKGAKEP
jgi:hypothetical protein